MNHEKVAILVDSGSDVPAELLERYHIFMIPLKILFHEAEYLDGLTIDAGEVYRRLPTEVPKTSLPDGGLITSVLDRIYQEGYRKVLAICISGHLSGTCNLLRLLCDEYEGLECCVIDSKNISIGSGILAIRCAQLLEEGMDFASLCQQAQQMIGNSKIFFCLKTLEYLQKGGRCSTLAALGANLLKLKPCIEVKDGKMGVGKKYRGKIDNCIAQYVRERLQGRDDLRRNRIFITHSGCAPEIVENVKAIIKECGGFDEVLETYAGCTVSSHCGPNTLGVLFVRK